MHKFWINAFAWNCILVKFLISLYFDRLLILSRSASQICYIINVYNRIFYSDDNFLCQKHCLKIYILNYLWMVMLVHESICFIDLFVCLRLHLSVCFNDCIFQAADPPSPPAAVWQAHAKRPGYQAARDQATTSTQWELWLRCKRR